LTDGSGAPMLREWLGGSGEADPGHRHFSHLWPLFPGGAVRPRATPRAAAAARNALLRRLEHGGGHTGWSTAWVANLWARLEDGDAAQRALRALWRRFTLPNLVSTHPNLAPTRDKETLPLKCATCYVEQPSPAEGGQHVFQVDGLLGALSAVSEMLVQSHAAAAAGSASGSTRGGAEGGPRGGALVELLPALPTEWRASGGFVKGLRARGGVEIVELRWASNGGALRFARIRVRGPTQCHVRWGGNALRVRRGGVEVAVSTAGDNEVVRFAARPGVEYVVEPAR
jgi:alpha-L-fucosidase 2